MNRHPFPLLWIRRIGEKYFITVRVVRAFRNTFFLLLFPSRTGLHTDIHIIPDCSNVREAMLMLAVSNFAKGQPLFRDEIELEKIAYLSPM